jgi:hypothetical protein
VEYIKRRRTEDVLGSGSSSRAVMARLGAEDDDEEEEEEEEEFSEEGTVVNQVGQRTVLNDVELTQFLYPSVEGGVVLSPLFGCVA